MTFTPAPLNYQTYSDILTMDNPTAEHQILSGYFNLYVSSFDYEIATKNRSDPSPLVDILSQLFISINGGSEIIVRPESFQFNITDILGLTVETVAWVSSNEFGRIEDSLSGNSYFKNINLRLETSSPNRLIQYQIVSGSMRIS